jgi:hypothetical protein
MSDAAQLFLLLVGSTAVTGYGACIGILVMRADFYTKGQKIAQLVLILALPILGALVAHLIFRQQQASPLPVDRNFIPQQGPRPDELPRTHNDAI